MGARIATLNNTFSTVHYLNFYFSDPEYLQHFFPDSFFILRLMSLHCSTCAQKSRTNSIGMRHQVWKVQRRLILQQNSPRKVTWRGSQDRLIRDYEVALVQTGEWNSTNKLWKPSNTVSIKGLLARAFCQDVIRVLNCRHEILNTSDEDTVKLARDIAQRQLAPVTVPRVHACMIRHFAALTKTGEKC